MQIFVAIFAVVGFAITRGIFAPKKTFTSARGYCVIDVTAQRIEANVREITPLLS